MFLIAGLFILGIVIVGLTVLAGIFAFVGAILLGVWNFLTGND